MSVSTCSRNKGGVSVVIFIVEEGSIWNERNPILEKYADSVVVVCLYGKAVTDKYRCIVSPKRQVRLGMDAYGTESFLFGAISLAKEELKACISHEKDIVFLTDNEPRSLYPYILLKNECEGKGFIYGAYHRLGLNLNLELRAIIRCCKA